MMELVAKYLSGNANEVEKGQVEEWRNENPEEFLSYSEAWAASGFQSFNTVAASAAVRARIQTQQRFDDPEAANGAPKRKWFWIAAAIAVLAGISYFFLYDAQSPDSGFLSTDGWVMAKTEPGETKEIELPDGSVVTLNESSTMSYPPEFATQREVNFSGTGFFEIAPDAAYPFTVETSEAIVTVLGTSFQVKAEMKANYSEVIVETGQVRLTKKPRPQVAEKPVRIELTPGDIGVVRGGGAGVAKTKNSDPNYLSWKTRKMVFSKTPMKKVVAKLNEVYKVDIQLANQQIENCKLTATFDQKSVDEVIEVISQTFAFEVASSSGKYTLNGKSCQ